MRLTCKLLIVPVMEGNYSTLELNDSESFSFVLTSLWEADSGIRRVVINIPDTILYKDGIPHRWLFTSEQTGEIMKRKGDKLMPSEIIRTFKSKSRSLRGFKDQSSKQCVATIWYMTSKSTMSSFLVDDVQLASILHEQIVLEILAIQVFMGGWPVKASGILEHHFWVRKNSSVGHETFELACVVNGQNISTFSHNIDRLLICDSHHDSCKSYALRVIKRLELAARAKVANIVLQFVFNSSFVPFLVGARSIYFWDPPSHFWENRSKFCYLSGACPEVSSDYRSRILPHTQRTALNATIGSQEFRLVRDDTNNSIQENGSQQHSRLDDGAQVRNLPGSQEDEGGGEYEDYDNEDFDTTMEQKATKTTTFSVTTDVFTSVDSEEPISPNYVPPVKQERPASKIFYSDEDLPFRSAKLELGRLNGAGRRPLSASATGVYYPGAESAAVTAAVGRSKRASGILSFLNGTGPGLEFTRKKAPMTGERAHCEQMTESLRTRLHYYSSQVKEAEVIPLERFLKKRQSINAPHGSKERPKSHSGSRADGKHHSDIQLGGHGIANGGRRSSGLEKKMPSQSGTVCFGDYCGLTCFPDVDPALGTADNHVQDKAEGIHASNVSASESKGPDEEMNVHTLGLGSTGGSMPTLKQAVSVPDVVVDRRPEILPHQLPFRSVLLARAEEHYNGHKLWADSHLDLNVGQHEPEPLADGNIGLTQLAHRHLKRVGRACLAAVERIIHHSNEQSYNDAWDALNKEYRNQIYADALCKVHPSRFYHTVPLCDQCWKLYSLLDFYRESIVFGVLSEDARPKITTRRRPKSSSALSRGNPTDLLEISSRVEGDANVLLSRWRQAHDQDVQDSLISDEAKEESITEFITHNMIQANCSATPPGIAGRDVSVGISTKNGTISSWVQLTADDGSLTGGLPPMVTRPSTSRGDSALEIVDSRNTVGEMNKGSRRDIASRKDRISATKSRRSRQDPDEHVAGQQLQDKLGRGIAPLQQKRLQAAPLGNMLSQRAGNHGGERDLRGPRGKAHDPHQIRPHSSSTHRKEQNTLPRPKSAVTSSQGIFRGDNVRTLNTAPSAPSLAYVSDEERYSDALSQDLSAPNLRSTSVEFSNVMADPTLCFSGALSFRQPWAASGLVDITRSVEPAKNLLSLNDYNFSSLPYSTAPTFPLPSLSVDSGDDYEYGLGPTDSKFYTNRAVASDGDQLQSKDQNRGGGQGRTKSRATTASTGEKNALANGYLGGLDLNQKIEEVTASYGRRPEKLILGKRYDGRERRKGTTEGNDGRDRRK